jgi:hypothetical protein
VRGPRSAALLSSLEVQAFFGPSTEYTVSMSIDEIVAEALRLPVEQRALVAESLWESIEDPFETPMDDATATALAIERDRQMEAGEVTPVLHAEMMRRLRR